MEVTIPGASRPDRVQVDVRGPGDGTTIVLLHGWGSSAALMVPLATRLAGRFRTVSLDFPGHGASPVPHMAWDVPAQAFLVREVLARFAPGPAVLVGHSNGGRVALHLMSAPDAPAAVRALVLIGPSGIRRRRTPSYYLRSWTARTLKAPFALLPGPLRAFGLDWLRHSLVWKLLGSSDYQALEGVMRETFVKTVNHYVEDRIGAIRVPVVVLRGANDDAVSADQVARLAAGIPDAGLVTLPGAGHYAHMDAPDAVVAAITEVAT